MLGAILGIGIVGLVFSVIQVGQVLLWRWFDKHKQARELLGVLFVIVFKPGGKHGKRKD